MTEGKQRVIMKNTYTKDETDMWFWAFRYALPSGTSAAHHVVDFLLNHWLDIPLQDRQQMVDEIEAGFVDGIKPVPGHSVELWQEIIDRHRKEAA